MGSDIFTSKCEAHNYVVPYRSSCPVCVSAKRSQLHAANMAHMPRYLFEQTLDVQADATGVRKPVRSFMKAPEQAKPCDVRWKVNFRSDQLQHYTKLATTTQALIMALDVTTDAKLLKMRWEYQQGIAALPKEEARLQGNLAIDMWHEIVRATRIEHKDDNVHRFMGQFTAYFGMLYDRGQRLIVDEAQSAPTTPAKYVLNFSSVESTVNLTSTTQQLLRKLDKYEDGLGKMRMEHEGYIAQFPTEIQARNIAISQMAVALWNKLVMSPTARGSSKVMEQFLTTVVRLYNEGQRLVEVQVPVLVTVPAKYKLTLKSRNWHGHYELLQETQEAFRILEFGIPEVYQRWYSLCVSVARHNITVDSMAYTMWDTLVKQPELRELKGDMTVRQDFVARFKYLYQTGVGQRIVIEETPAQPERKRSYADDVYDFIMTSNKELYHRQCLLETKLEASHSSQTRAFLITAFRDFARDACDFYTMHKMPNYNALDTGHVYTLQTILADAYLEGRRR